MAEPATDNQLLLAVAEGDEAAFAILFKTYAALLEDTVMRMVHDHYGTKEVLQETFIKIWLNREKLPGVTHLTAYLQKIALNEGFNYLNRLARQQLLQFPLQDTSAAEANPEDDLAYKETAAIIRQAVDTLPAQRKMIFTLNRHEQLNAVQIGERLNLTPEYVRQAISAARRQIREALVKAGKLLVTVAAMLH